MVDINNKVLGYTLGVLLLIIGIVVFFSSLVSFNVGGILAGVAVFLVGLFITGVVWHHYSEGDLTCCGKKLYTRSVDNTQQNVTVETA